MAWTIQIVDHRIIGTVGNRVDQVIVDAIWNKGTDTEVSFLGNRLNLVSNPVPRNLALGRLRDTLNSLRDAALIARPIDPSTEILNALNS